MTTRVQSQRFSITNTRPSTATRPSGEFWLNYPDLRLGMIDPSQTAVDLLAVRNYTASASYTAGDYAVYSGQLQRAKVTIAPHAYNAAEWDPLVTQSFTDGLYTTQAQNDARYVKLIGSVMTGYLTLVGDPVAPLNPATKRYTDAQDALKLNLSGGTLTGPLILAGDPTVPNGAATKGYIDTLVGNYLPLTGGVLSGTLRVANGRLLSSNAGNNPSVTVWDTNQGYAAGMFLGGGNNLYFGGMDGGGNFTGTFGYWDSGGSLHVNNNLYVGNDIHAPHIYADSALGITYAGTTGHWIAFGWNGNINCYVDGGYTFDIASTSWVNANFATYGWVQTWVNGNFYPAGTTDGRYLYKSGDTCTGDLHINGMLQTNVDITANRDVHCQHVFTHSTSNSAWALWHQDGGPIYIRMDSAYDYGPIPYWSDGRAKKDIAPAQVDCLDAVQRIELKQFRWREGSDQTLVPLGFVTQQLEDVCPALVNKQPKDLPPYADERGTFYESVNINTMLALLAGAVQQLAKERHA